MKRKKPDFDSLWENAINEFPPDPSGAVGQLINEWANLLGSEVVRYGKEENTAVFLIDLSQLMLRGLDTNILMVVHPTDDPIKEKRIYELLEYSAEKAAAAHCLCFVLFLQQKKSISRKLHPELIDIVVMDRESIRKQFLSGITDTILFNIITKQVRISRLCPFDTTCPARGEMFVGRREELRSLVQNLDTNYLVTGSRRVGKSSLLFKASDILKRRKELRDRVHMFYCETWGGFKSGARHIANYIDPREEERIDKAPFNLVKLFRVNSNYGTKPLILFFDEFDRVADNEAKGDWTLSRCLLNAVEKKYIRVTIAGYRSVLKLEETVDSPFYHKLITQRLSPLDETDAFSLFIIPFHRLGIKVVHPDILSKKILNLSGGYPFVIQFYGERLFQKIIQKDSKELTVDDIQVFEDSFEFDEYIIGHFLENTEKFERLLAIYYALTDDNEPWSEDDFRKKLCNKEKLNLTIEDIHKAARNLVLANIFKFQNGSYSFIFPAFRKQLKRHWKDLDIRQVFTMGAL